MKFYTLKELAREILHRREDTVRYWVKTGQLKAGNYPGEDGKMCIRVSERQLEEFERSREMQVEKPEEQRVNARPRAAKRYVNPTG